METKEKMDDTFLPKNAESTVRVESAFVVCMYISKADHFVLMNLRAHLWESVHHPPSPSVVISWLYFLF